MASCCAAVTSPASITPGFLFSGNGLDAVKPGPARTGGIRGVLRARIGGVLPRASCSAEPAWMRTGPVRSGPGTSACCCAPGPKENNLARGYVFRGDLAEAQNTIQRAINRKLELTDFVSLQYQIAFLKNERTE